MTTSRATIKDVAARRCVHGVGAPNLTAAVSQ